MIIITALCTVRYIVFYFVILSWLIIIPTPNIGNVYIADRYSSRIRKVTVSTGIIATIAGSGTSSYSGDNGPATSAALYEPFGVALDASGGTLHHCLLHYLSQNI